MEICLVPLCLCIRASCCCATSVICGERVNDRMLPNWQTSISKLNTEGRKKCISSCKGLLSLHCIARGWYQLLRGWLTLRELGTPWHRERRPHTRRWQTCIHAEILINRKS